MGGWGWKRKWALDGISASLNNCVHHVYAWRGATVVEIVAILVVRYQSSDRLLTLLS
jgi:hypothetical protein